MQHSFHNFLIYLFFYITIYCEMYDLNCTDFCTLFYS